MLTPTEQLVQDRQPKVTNRWQDSPDRGGRTDRTADRALKDADQLPAATPDGHTPQGAGPGASREPRSGARCRRLRPPPRCGSSVCQAAITNPNRRVRPARASTGPAQPRRARIAARSPWKFGASSSSTTARSGARHPLRRGTGERPPGPGWVAGSSHAAFMLIAAVPGPRQAGWVTRPVTQLDRRLQESCSRVGTIQAARASIRYGRGSLAARGGSQPGEGASAVDVRIEPESTSP
jgi:hypothetical protein